MKEYFKLLLGEGSKASMQRFGTLVYLCISIFWTLAIATYIFYCTGKGQSVEWTGAIAMLSNSYLFTGIALGIKAFQKKFEV